MTNVLYPVRRVLFFGAIVAGIVAITVAAFAAQSIRHGAQREALFTISPGERLSTFWSDLEAAGLASPSAVARLGETASFPQYPFVPPPSSNPSRFEGLFAPGGYRIRLSAASSLPSGERLYRDDLQIVDALLAHSAARLARFAGASGPPTYDDMILASIVQKEDVPGRSYDLVASVFLNRLSAGMRLGSCPTLEYALGYHRPFLLDRDIAIKTPYNTYLNPGLPPTPICAFADRALEAVMRPVSSPYFFFVLDWVKDRIYFAKSYAEQERNAQIARADYIQAYGAASLHKKEIGVFY